MKRNDLLAVDLIQQVRKIHEQRKRRRTVACCFAVVFVAFLWFAIRSLNSSRGFGHVAAIIALWAWGCWAVKWAVKQ